MMIYLSNEEWKDIPGYENEYEVSSLGRIRTKEGKATSNARYSHRVWKQRYLKFKWSTRHGGKKDARVSLWHNGEVKTVLVARCVCMAFHEVDDYKDLTANHINGDTTDNRASNLEWVTRAENIKHAFNTGLMPTNKITLCDNDGNKTTFNSLSDASRSIGRNCGYISNRTKRGHNTVIASSGIAYTIV